MPVYKMQQEMPYDELLKWITFYKRRPHGWQEDHRTYMLLSAQGVKEKPEKLFSSLKAITEFSKPEATDDKAMPKGAFLSKMKAAKHGDDSGWDFSNLEVKNE